MPAVLEQVESFYLALAQQVQETVARLYLEQGNLLEEEEEVFTLTLVVVLAVQAEC